MDAGKLEMPKPSAWVAKARALDRYRWQLLRERHGLLGSAFRFAREALGDWLFGLRARARLANALAVESCDFLLLQSAPKVIAFQRKTLLIRGVRARGHSLIETALQERKSILGSRLLKKPLHSVPLRYFGYAAYAEWLVEKYQPKVLLNDRNGSLYTPFLRLALNARQRLLVHLAHATTVESSPRLGMNDYDYYFLFGQSSLDALHARRVLFGESTAVLAGSHMIDTALDLPPADPEQHVLLILGLGPDKEKEASFQISYAVIRDWAATNSEYQVLVKAHPRSRTPFWHEAAERLDNVQVLPATCGIAEALSRASVVVNFMSNAVVEATLARRPVIYVNAGGNRDIFSQEQFFGGCVTNIQGLTQRIDALKVDYPQSLQRSAQFAEYHLAHGVKGLANTLSRLDELLLSGQTEGSRLPLSPKPNIGGL